ncbi:hypothetical protein ACIBK9_19570 [Nonomuraea sp. NPDC050227]|uniref:hypothetical protein n=1 Tax=Nonomuraea sp. NPDC050227 TaxID=3364360 RepID=UPI0037A136E0
MNTPSPRRGWAAITPGRLYYAGHVGAGGMHAHHAVQLLVGDGLVLRGGTGPAHEVRAALSSLSRGATLTAAAHAAGFSDAAHLTRTVRRMMGDAPSALATGVRWLEG